MPGSGSTGGSLLAISDIHVGYEDNRSFLETVRPGSDDDWLLVAGDVAERMDDILWALRLLRDRFARVLWVPGNHELWSHPSDPIKLRGELRYRYLVERCRELGIDTPEDPYPVWTGADGPVTVAPLFLLYDYTFRPPGAQTKEEALDRAYAAGIVCTDESLLHPDPYPSREAWCAARLGYTEQRLAAVDPALPTILVNHWPMTREPTEILRYPEFAQWCGTVRTADWHRRYRAAAVVYGHLHIPRTIWLDGVPFIESSVGYPREWRRYRGFPQGPRRILPLPERAAQ